MWQARASGLLLATRTACTCQEVGCAAGALGLTPVATLTPTVLQGFQGQGCLAHNLCTYCTRSTTLVSTLRARGVQCRRRNLCALLVCRPFYLRLGTPTTASGGGSLRKQLGQQGGAPWKPGRGSFRDAPNHSSSCCFCISDEPDHPWFASQPCHVGAWGLLLHVNLSVRVPSRHEVGRNLVLQRTKCGLGGPASCCIERS